ncbi:MAG TPA: 30S ribosomal protein S8 [Bacteroidota bacterium]|nr:30S ribosomal protein S8 [Bacteroidota bacterium]
MQSTDPVADFLTRIRNAINARHKRVDVPVSYLKREISKIFLEQKYISGFSEINADQHVTLRLTLRYADGVSAITGLRRVSKPGLRIYASKSKLPRVLNGLGIAIISTSKGLMTNKQAQLENVGGEVLCEVW